MARHERVERVYVAVDVYAARVARALFYIKSVLLRVLLLPKDVDDRIDYFRYLIFCRREKRHNT